ncbi:uncharacterized protein [Phyllobates terribilis]|uniref:uncharacterized protein n=1 Tax=Phyllobates terribilis TaxID=111132 RepID=UPI003CCB4FE9
MTLISERGFFCWWNAINTMCALEWNADIWACAFVDNDPRGAPAWNDNYGHAQSQVPTISDPLSEDLLFKRIFLMDPSKMDMDRDKMAERILHLTLEILFRLTGEDYTLVKKTASVCCQAPVSKGWERPLSPITGPPSHPLIHEDINDQKILDLTYKMIELLTGEVPIRCQDVAVYFSMEEWEYLEGHKDLYKDIMMEVPQPLTSPDLSSKRTTPERCPHPFLPHDCKQEDPNVPQDHQGEDLTHINTTETYVRGDERCKEEIPTYDYPAFSIEFTTWRIHLPPVIRRCYLPRSVNHKARKSLEEKYDGTVSESRG